MNTKFLLVLSVFLSVLLISCSDDHEQTADKTGNCIVTVKAGNSEYKYQCVYETGTNDGLGVMTLTTEGVKDNTDYGIFTGAKVIFEYRLQGTGVYDVVSAKRLSDKNSEQQVSIYMELGDKSGSFLTYQSWSDQDQYVGITENAGNYYISISDNIVNLYFSGGQISGNSKEDLPQVIEIKMQMNLLQK